MNGVEHRRVGAINVNINANVKISNRIIKISISVNFVILASYHTLCFRSDLWSLSRIQILFAKHFSCVPCFLIDVSYFLKKFSFTIILTTDILNF